MKRQGLLIGDGRAPALVTAWTNLATAVQSLLADLQPLSAAYGRMSRVEAAGAIGVYLRYFDGATAAEQVGDRLLKLVLAERALLPVGAELDQPVEFVQFSANTRTLLAPGNGSVPASQQLDSVTKLRGVEFHHFAAFYKSSWRAWDWMWGRLDGCGWLVHILLDPRRILAVVEGMPTEAFQEKGTRAATFADLLRQAAALPAGLPGDCLETDLAFLDDHTADIPVSLPNSALFLAQAWQNLITANELPVIADRMAPDGATRQATPPDAWVTTIRRLQHPDTPPADFARQLPQCPVRQETLAGELRTPAFARLATKAAAVATAAVATAPEAPGAVRPVLASARTITRTGYQATKVTGGSGWKTLLAGVVLAVIGGVLATQGMIVVGLTGSIIALAGALPDRPGRLGHPPRRTRCPRHHHRAGHPGVAHAELGPHPAVGRRAEEHERLCPHARPAVAPRLVVGRAGRPRRHHRAGRPAQPDSPGAGRRATAPRSGPPYLLSAPPHPLRLASRSCPLISREDPSRRPGNPPNRPISSRPASPSLPHAVGSVGCVPVSTGESPGKDNHESVKSAKRTHRGRDRRDILFRWILLDDETTAIANAPGGVA